MGVTSKNRGTGMVGNLKFTNDAGGRSLRVQSAPITRAMTSATVLLSLPANASIDSLSIVGAAQSNAGTTATISDGKRVLATVTVGLPLGKDVLALIRRNIPLPAHASLVLLYDGRHVRHYALTDHKEFFAEMTEAYFGENDFFPFNRAELMESEPEIYKLLTDIWDPPAKGRP